MNLLALHGSTMNGELMRRQLDFVQRAIPRLDVIAPDAPHAASKDLIDHLYEVWKEPRPPPPTTCGGMRLPTVASTEAGTRRAI